jgi:ribonuclease E
MSKEIYISSTPHETRLAIVEDEALTEIYYERENEYTLAGSIYNGRVTRVLPGMQSSFVDIGLERDAFLYITDFLEEAPDSEEFDTTPHGDRPPRTIEGEAAGSRSEAGPRNGERSERGDRGGRGRRGGRDRDRNNDRGTSDRGDAPRVTAPQVDSSSIPAPASDGAELGEGAPGADGNRRWRGRRGRRRGRGTPGQPGDATQENTAPVSSDEAGYPAESSSDDSESYREIDGAAEEPAAAPVASESRSERGRRKDGRGGQRRDGQRSDSSRRDQGREPRAPRGFAPSRDLYGVASDEAHSTGPIADAYDAAPAGEPVILPGESLSKYRKGEEANSAPAASTTAHATTVTLAPPANLYTLAEGWDGGATLPGETLRRRPAESGGEQRRPQRDSDREPRRDSRGGREGRADTRRDNRSGFRNTSNEPEQSQSREPLHVQHISASEPDTVHEESHASFGDLPEAALPHEASAVAVPELTPIHEVEYEPSDASASYRVDPVARSEFRQGAPVMDEPTEDVDESHPAASTHSITPAPGEHAARLHSESQGEAPAPAHDITSLGATGEMHSDPIETIHATEHLPAPIETPQAASPIRHEGAVVDAEAADGYAHGSGEIDEEMIDDELEGTTLQASSIEEMDDLDDLDGLDEETLEGAADLGTMLREMSIDQITRKAPVEDEDDADDDLDEDDLDEEDLDHDEEEEQDGGNDFQMEDHAAGSEYDPQEQAARIGNAADAEFFGQQFAEHEAGEEGQRSNQSTSDSGTEPKRSPGRDSDRRGGRRERDGRRGRSDRDRGGDRSRRTGGQSEGGHGRRSMQTTNLPAISDLLKPGQEILVQIAKEPIAKKGARITSHIALPGRFLVFMPTVNHTGVSRKIESDGERRRLKEILLSEKGEATGGFIVRTAAEGASEEELRSDLRFLLNLWADIKSRSESSKSPALIYHDLNLIERILRDQVTDNFSAIWVDTEAEYERVLRFLQRFQPSLIRRVKLYLKETPLFEQFGITEEINKALRSKVWLKSGGSIVINQTEALVAIDINTGKFVGKTARLEDTIVKTNLDAIPEIVRQIRLRDLGGIIIIDFIDMDERKNRNRVMAALEDELKSDRAPSKVLQFNDFGLVAITRKRVKQSLERTLSTPCNVCTGTGMVKSPVTVCNDIYIEMRKMHKHLDRGDVMLRVHPDVVKQLKISGAKWLQEMEEMCGKTILVKSDPSLHPEQFDIH